MQSYDDIQATQLYNKVMSIPQVQRLYQSATCSRKDNYRNVRLQDTVLVRLCGYAGNNLYKPFEYEQLTKKEQAFYDAFDYYITDVETSEYTVMYTSSDIGENGIYQNGKLIWSWRFVRKFGCYDLSDIRFFKQWQLQKLCYDIQKRFDYAIQGNLI